MATATSGFWVRTAFAFVAVLALAGCGNSDNPGTASATTTVSAESWFRPDAPPDKHTLLRAGEAALAKVPGGTLISIEFEANDEGTWKTEVVTPDGTEQQMKVGTDGYTVLVGPTPKTGSDADKTEHRALVAAVHLDYRVAMDKVLAAVPNGSITELDLDDKNGATVWEAAVWDTELVKHEVAIDAASGDLVANNQGP